MAKLTTIMTMIALLLIACLMLMAHASSLTILVVMDGYRSSYLGKSKVLLNKMAKHGGVASNFVPIFPTSRLPNLASMVTGKFAESHGIVDNVEVFDNGKNVFSHQHPFWSQFHQLDSIWDLHAKKYGVNSTHLIGIPEQLKHLLFEEVDKEEHKEEKKDKEKKDDKENKERKDEHKKEEDNTKSSHKTATTASRSDHGDNHGHRVRRDTTSQKEQIARASLLLSDLLEPQNLLKQLQQILEKKTNQSSTFVTIFVSEPGLSAQVLGPDNVDGALERVDVFLHDLLALLDSKKVRNETNVIVTSTPGYYPIKEEGLIDMRGLSKNSNFEMIGSTPVLNLRLKDQNLDEGLALFSSLLSSSARLKSFSVYTKERFEPNLHYSKNSRIQSLVVVAKPGHGFVFDFLDRLQILKRNNTKGVFGINGYEWEGIEAELNTFVVVNGPAFVSTNTTVVETAFASIVDIFGLLGHALNLGFDEDNKGGNLSSLLRSEEPDSTLHRLQHKLDNFIHMASEPHHRILTASLLTGALVLLLSCCCVLLARRRTRRMLSQEAFRYSQIRNNRRAMEDEDDDEEGGNDKRGLLLNEDNDKDNVEEFA